MSGLKITENITADIQRKTAALDAVPEKAYRYFVDKTPRRSGNARRKTRRDGNSIDADYPYAERLNEGWSKQAPQGMWRPTEKYIIQLLDRIVRSWNGRI